MGTMLSGHPCSMAGWPMGTPVGCWDLVPRGPCCPQLRLRPLGRDLPTALFCPDPLQGLRDRKLRCFEPLRKGACSQGLFHRVLREEISLAKLVRMKPEELVSKELSVWKERPTKPVSPARVATAARGGGGPGLSAGCSRQRREAIGPLPLR